MLNYCDGCKMYLETPCVLSHQPCCVECGHPVKTYRLGTREAAFCARVAIQTGEQILWCSPECMEKSVMRCQGKFTIRSDEVTDG